MSSRLLRRPTPYPNESMIGYLIRLSSENGYENLTPILQILGETKLDINQHRIRAICSGKIDMDYLSYLTDKPRLDLENLLVIPEISKKNIYFKINNTRISDELMNFRSCSVCIDCLKEERYHRKIWSISTYTTCIKHNTYMRDTCPKCGSLYTWSKVNLIKCNCGFDITKVKSKKADNAEMLLSIMTDNAYKNSIIHTHPLIKDMNSLYAALLFCYSLFYRYPWSNSELDLSCYTNNIRHEQISNSFKIFTNWPYSFYEYLHATLKSEKISYSALRDSALLYRLNMTLDRSPIKKICPFIYDSITQELNYFLTNKSLQDSNIDLSKRIKINSDNLAKLVTLKEAANILNLSIHNTKTLLNKNIIYSENDKRNTLINVKTLNNLLKEIKKSTNFVASNDSISLLKFLKKYQIISARTLDELIIATLKKRLPIVNFDQEEGLPGIFFSKKELFDYINYKKTTNKKILNVNDIKNDLNVYPDAIYRLMNIGLLPYQTAKINLKFSQRYILSSELEKFKKQYILPNEMAKLFETNVTNIAERLKHLGIHPVSGPNIDNGLVYVFNRKEVMKVDKLQLNKINSYQTRTGRPLKGEPSLKSIAKSEYLDSKAVAEILGNNASIQKVARLVRKGFLSVVDHFGELGNKHYFTHEAISAYLKSYRNNPNLIKLEDIPQWLSIDKRRLEIDWLKSGRLTLVDDGLGQKYANITHLEEINKIRKSVLSTAELANETNRTRHDVNNAIRLGYLLPISGPGFDNYPNFLFDKETSISIFKR